MVSPCQPVERVDSRVGYAARNSRCLESRLVRSVVVACDRRVGYVDVGQSTDLPSSTINGQLGFAGGARRTSLAQSRRCTCASTSPSRSAPAQRHYGYWNRFRSVGVGHIGSLAHVIGLGARLLRQAVVSRPHGLAVPGHERTE